MHGIKDEDCISLLESEQILTSNSDEKQTERAWRHWAGKNHPDKHPEDIKRYTEKFQKTSDCYDRIKSTSKKTKPSETSSESFDETMRKFNQYFKEKKSDIPEKDTFLSYIRLLCQFYKKLKSTTFKDQDYVVLKSHLQLFIIQCIAFTIIFLVGYYIGITDDIFDHIQWMIVHEGIQIGGMIRRSKRIMNQSTNDLTNDLMNEVGNILIQGGLTIDDKEEVASQIGLIQTFVGLQDHVIGLRERESKLEDEKLTRRERESKLEDQGLTRRERESRLKREETKFRMEIIHNQMFYVANGVWSFCIARLTTRPLPYVVAKLLKTSNLFDIFGMYKINSDTAIIKNIAEAFNYIYAYTAGPVFQIISEELGTIGYGIEDNEIVIFTSIMFLVFGITWMLFSVVNRIVGIRMIGGGLYKNRKKYSAKRKSKSAKRKSKSTKRKSKSTKRKSKTAKRKSKTVKRKSKTAKRKSKF